MAEEQTTQPLQALSNSQQESGQNDPEQRKANVRRRTKTGCLTCRKRRIKCDEGRPICNNCIKSKRQCEGYNQRVIFKEPMNALAGSFNPAVHPDYASYLAGAFAAEHARSSRATLPAIAPRPPVFDHTQSTQGISHAHHNQSHTDASPYFTDGTVDYAFAHATGHIATSTHVTNPLLPLVRPGTEFRRSRSIPSRQVAGSSAHHQGPFIPQRLPAPQSSRMRDSRSPTQYRPSALQEKFGTQTRGDPIPDDDIFMADSDDESSVFSDSAAPRRQALMQAWNGPSAELRAFALDVDVFAYMEFTGQASSTGSSMDNMFTYFINVTSPTISLYERHPRDQGAQVGQPGKLTPNNYLWCYTIPLMSFHHPGLQQAILALATLQLANLRNVPATAAMKHYHLALRRIAKNVKVASKRTHIATLAATLLLAYFEVWSSDHTKWCNHLYGARILFLEIPLREMSRKCLPEMRRKERAREELSDSGGKAESLENKAFTDETGLDFALIRTITGIPVSAQDYGFGEPHLTATTATDRDILTYENYADLFWWYCKMDVYQSILGGTKLLMDYQNWTQCPPRSPLSRVKQICGTYDHLILLLGRLANFAAKDLRRKRQVWKARQTSSSSNDSPQPFPGIIPTQGNYQAPMGFSPPRESSPQSEKIAEDNDASVALDVALREWETIRQAFNVLKDHFGPEFRPLSGEYADRRESPFGAAVQYRSYAVAGVWMNYYMGLIHLHRAHPRMPPAAMQAAGMTAKETATYANQIGRIAAGLSDDSSKLVDVNPLGAAAFIESSFCLFVAGVQFQDAGQRHWLVQRMHDVSRLTGWRSARQIAGGCESSWTKAALIGHGPRYERNVDSINIPPSVWQNPRRIDKLLRQIERGPGEERRLVLASADRAFYAMGLLGVEEDLNVLDIEDDR